MTFDITQYITVLGVPLIDQLRFYTGHAGFGASLNANQNFNLPNKNLQTISLPGGTTTGIKVFPLTTTCLYPKEKTEFRICSSHEEDSNANSQGVIEVLRFYPKLTYTVELNKMFPFWAGGIQ